MNYQDVEKGLLERGFVNIEGMDSMGECHKDEKHYILRTDGLLIYSNIPFWDQTEYCPGSFYRIWTHPECDLFADDVPFTWEELDKLLCA